MNYLTVELGGTRTRVCLINSNYSLLRSNLHGGKITSIHDLLYVIKNFKDNCQYPIDEILLSLPGILTQDKTGVALSANLSCLQGLPLKTFLEEEFGHTVSLMNDIESQIHFYINQFPEIEKGHKTTLLTVGTGIGSTTIRDGEVEIGASGNIGEIGHIPVLGRYDKCECGLKGCLELYASGKYIDNKIKDSDIEGLTYKNILLNENLAEFKDSLVEGIAVAASTLINLGDPDHLIISGGVINMVGFFHGDLIAEIEKRTLTNHCNIITVKPSEASGCLGLVMSKNEEE